MTKITAAHPARTALVSASRRASSFSTIPRAGAASMFWSTGARGLGRSGVEVIDDDLGRSSSGIARPSFEKLLAAICEDRVGAVVSIEPSPLARNWCYWQNLIEFCGLVGRRIVDEDGVYDPRHPNDRLLLGIKGTMSRMELSMFRQRSLDALKQKAHRGELFLTVAIGYLKTSHNRGQPRMRRRGAKPSCRSSRRTTRAPERIGNTTRRILTIVWSRPNWGSAVTRRSLAVRALEDKLVGLGASAETTLIQLERERLLTLGADVESA